MREREKELGLYRLTVVRGWNKPKLIMIQHGYED
jgi:hypothetical protein